MSRRLTPLYIWPSLALVCYAYPTLSLAPRPTPPPSLDNVKRGAEDANTDTTSTAENNTVVGWYTTASGRPWSINTCGSGSFWSTSGSYGACAPESSSSLYTGCSGNWLVGGNATSSFSQQCVSAWSACTALYVATDLDDTLPVTYMICDISQGISRRSVYATTPDSTTSQSTTLPAAASSSSIPASTTAPTTPTPKESASTSSTTPFPIHKHKKLSGGAIAGIVIGILAFLSCGLAFLLWRRRKGRRTAFEGPAHNPAELPGHHDRKEIAGSEVKELPVDPAELPGSPNALAPEQASNEELARSSLES